jgi:hypothetical protein
MIDRKAVFAGERAAFEADYPELAHQVPHWIDIAERAFGVSADAIEERVRVLAEAGTRATEEQVSDAARTAARLALVDAGARWQRGVKRSR